MKQLTQKLKDGAMVINEVPLPVMADGMVLVKNHYSLISAGTEGSTVKTARKSLIGKAKERPQQAKQVLDVLKTQGVVQTYRAVMKKLDAYSPLGYSCAGEVIGVSPEIKTLKAGDFVACGGIGASHAEVVAVPEKLCAIVAPDADLKQAVYNTLGAIAMQGVRQADLRLGETCAVIGLGLLGQLTCLLLKASGVNVIGVDISEAMVETARENSADYAMTRSEPGIVERIQNITNGLGCDAVIITAGSDSLDPINFAGAAARKKGTVVVVGAVPTGFDREPHYYKKELQVKMSCSYGPGRYDPVYEEKGLDYPAAYVRWTENRNMQAFQDLIHTGRIDVSFLTTHVFKLENAPEAYDMIVKGDEPSVGILIEYDAEKKHDPAKAAIMLHEGKAERAPAKAAVGFIGAGSYAQSHLLPNLPKSEDVSLKGVMTATSAGARSAADRFKFEFCTSNATEIIDNDDINTVFIATRHDTHAQYVLKALAAGKNVFVEKPLCLKMEELDEITNLYSELKESKGPEAPILMVGYNRRFAPLTAKLKQTFPQGPLAAVYRINSGAIPSDSWIQDPEIGGGRVLGEVCHFVDLISFFTGALPVSVHAAAMKDPENNNDTLTVSLSFGDGSIGSVSYLANGDKSLPKERLEVFGNGCSGVLDDFKKLTLYVKGRKEEKKLTAQDKGQKYCVNGFLDAIRNGSGELVAFNEIRSASLVTFKILESIRTGQNVSLLL